MLKKAEIIKIKDLGIGKYDFLNTESTNIK